MSEPVLSKANDLLKARTASLSLGYNVVLTLIKLVAALLTGSVSLISETVHSASDVIASFVAFLSVRAASAPPDEEHPYGHGKIESLTGLGESALLLVTVVYIVIEAVHRIQTGGELKNLEFGIWVMFISAATSGVVSTYVRKAGVKTQSIALQSNGQHLQVDFWTSVGVLAALLVTKLTGWRDADGWFAIALALWISYGALGICRNAVNILIDRKMDDADVETVRRILKAEDGCISFHRLRTRSAGNVKYIDVHIVVPNSWSVVQAHDIADALEKKIQSELSPAYVVIHVDPFDEAKASQN